MRIKCLDDVGKDEQINIKRLNEKINNEGEIKTNKIEECYIMN